MQIKRKNVGLIIYKKNSMEQFSFVIMGNAYTQFLCLADGNTYFLSEGNNFSNWRKNRKNVLHFSAIYIDNKTTEFENACNEKQFFPVMDGSRILFTQDVSSRLFNAATSIPEGQKVREKVLFQITVSRFAELEPDEIVDKKDLDLAQTLIVEFNKKYASEQKMNMENEKRQCKISKRQHHDHKSIQAAELNIK